MLTAVLVVLIAVLAVLVLGGRALWLQASRVDLRALEGPTSNPELVTRIEKLEREHVARESELEEVRTHYMNHLKRLSAMIARAERLPERKDTPTEKSDFDMIQERRRGLGR